MKLAIMQPYFFPYIGYFQLINSADKFMLYENVSFRPKSWMTRNVILPNNGKLLPIHISVQKKSCNVKIDEIKLSNYADWEKSFCKTLMITYKKANYFNETFNLLEEILKEDFSNLHEFNSHIITGICKHIGINTIISTEHRNYINMEEEIRKQYSENEIEDYDNVCERKTIRIINICKTEYANAYYNAINGTTLYKKEDFLSHGIVLKFIQSVPTEYKQFNGHFTPNLSIIDVLMHCGKEGTNHMLNSYRIM